MASANYSRSDVLMGVVKSAVSYLGAAPPTIAGTVVDNVVETMVHQQRKHLEV